MHDATPLYLQAYISGLKLEGLALMADLVHISQSANRLMRALFEICLRRNWAPLAEAALLLCKAVQHRMWPSQTPLRQFKGKLKLPAQTLTTLEKKDIPWDRSALPACFCAVPIPMYAALRSTTSWFCLRHLCVRLQRQYKICGAVSMKSCAMHVCMHCSACLSSDCCCNRTIRMRMQVL